jgi:phosphoribosyl 1,2-cyclic phosphodiesterase
VLIRFWGTRGSLPVALTAAELSQRMAEALHAASRTGARFESAEQALEWLEATLPFAARATYGGASSCVQVDGVAPPDEYLVCDAGSGLRGFGHRVLSQQQGRPSTLHLLMSHPHWDHVMGFPFYTPVYIPGHRVRIYGGHDCLEQAFRNQHSAPGFPVDFSQLGASIEFIRLRPGEPCEIAGAKVSILPQLHAGDSYGYRIEHAGRVFVYSTDSEHKLDDRAQVESFVEFFREADLVVFDAMYSLADAISVKEDWGHSSNIVGVELCQMAGVRHLVMYHHEPIHSDARIDGVLAETRRFEELTREDRPALQVSAAWDGLEIDLGRV